jgi:hypothetical protein
MLTEKEKQAIRNYADKWDGGPCYGDVDGRR